MILYKIFLEIFFRILVAGNENDKNIAGNTEYGFSFTSAVENNNIFGVQFHPEKSHNYGKKFLKNFYSK